VRLGRWPVGALRTLWAARDISTQQLQAIGNLFLTEAMTLGNLAQGQATFSGGKRIEPRLR